MYQPRSETLPDLLDEMADLHPDRNLLIYNDERVSYSEFRQRARALAKGLYALGVRKGDKVGVWMGNQTEWVLLVYATTMLGATFVALNTWWRGRELQYALGLAEVKVFIFAEKYIQNDYLEAVKSMGNLSQVLPQLEVMVCLSSGHSGPNDYMTFQSLIAGGNAISDAQLADAQRAVRPEDVALIIFTSGSTAFPKAVQNCHYGLVRNPFQIGERMRLTNEDRIYIGISLFWGFGVANALMAIMTHGACMVLQHRFEASEGLKLIERHACTGLYATPNIAIALQSHPDRVHRRLGSLRTGIGLPAGIASMVALGAVEACSVYGLTECYGNSVVSDAKDTLEVRQYTCGFPLPDTEVVIADPLSHEPLARGEVGEIKLKGYITPGYYKAPTQTEEALDEDGYFLTGDLGMLDENGYLRFRGRLKEIVKSGGINISPAEVEEILRTHEAIEQAFVVGVPDQTLDQALVAVLVIRSDRTVSDEALKLFCRQQMATYKVPRHFIQLASAEIPLTNTGKPDKMALEALVIKRTAASAAYIP